MFDPRIDILSAEWSVFKPVPWLLPMLSDLSGWRRQIDILEKEIVSWANNSNALFLADFPGLQKLSTMSDLSYLFQLSLFLFYYYRF